jgi:hypothetical protein
MPVLVTVKKPAGAIQFYNDGADRVVALAGSLPRAETDDENVEVWERVFDAPSPEDAIIMMIDAKRILRRIRR